mmetsp:Transcript_10230/g.16758  ORF Transcript_10230/g.16758 Transcript_10230/m.16758 type:complete len:217 (-) Transcript_10230:353-1003(-)|eukprot:CAMPEP_0184651954 /NCGR_PEP_ID=MMETSP0308-20130426/9620_1 /TAXON_ID=38269 /ORGANISM="Gloeochaete witrockiana, Strain SAG 46.84" /LENGTH=216 /DNA_ID=CAMNT_0027086537 /DNA_START=260 /DNA_END=910 /DNA_ORIENTATION=-
MKVGVLALQGDVAEHVRSLQACGAEAVEVRRPKDLENVDGLIIPGGESTTMGKLLRFNHLFEPIDQRIREGMPVLGTCAGAILLAKDVVGQPDLPRFGCLDIEIERNAYGAQLESFQTSCDVPAFGELPLPAIFIRAPVIHSAREGVDVLGSHNDKPVLVRSKNLVAATFHSELSQDVRLHRYFVEMVAKHLGVPAPEMKSSDFARRPGYVPVYFK